MEQCTYYLPSVGIVSRIVVVWVEFRTVEILFLEATYIYDFTFTVAVSFILGARMIRQGIVTFRHAFGWCGKKSCIAVKKLDKK